MPSRAEPPPVLLCLWPVNCAKAPVRRPGQQGRGQPQEHLVKDSSLAAAYFHHLIDSAVLKSLKTPEVFFLIIIIVIEDASLDGLPC